MTQVDPTPAEHPQTPRGEIRAGREKPIEILAEAMFEKHPGGAIEAMESRGQQQLVASTKLPVKTGGGYADNDDKPFLDLGFTFGPADEDDPLFREATLPEGWRKEGSDHAMWSYIVDADGEQRVGIFFKAAFYDRHAFMHIIRMCSCGHSINSHPYVDSKYPGPYKCGKCGCDGAPLMEANR